jgi:hypothetical protein
MAGMVAFDGAAVALHGAAETVICGVGQQSRH